MSKTYIVKVSAEIEVSTTTEVSARKVVNDNFLLSLRNMRGCEKFDIESIKEKKHGIGYQERN